jgi:hypothetical protein
MAGQLLSGVNENLYYNSGTYGSPVWVLITTAIDVSLGLDKSKAAVKSRLNTWVMNLCGLKAGPLEFGLLGDTSVAIWDTLKAAFVNDTAVEFAVSDGLIATTGSEYFRALYYLFGFPIDQKLEEAQVAKVSADLAYTVNLPVFTTVGS